MLSSNAEIVIIVTKQDYTKDSKLWGGLNFWDGTGTGFLLLHIKEHCLDFENKKTICTGL